VQSVRDIMHTKVVTVRPGTPVHELVRTLARNRISGVPVVTDFGEIRGVVSATDVMALNAFGPCAHVPEAWDTDEGADDEESEWYFRASDPPPPLGNWDHVVSSYVVEDIMTPAAFSVDPSDSIPALARFLLQGRIHRALVIEDHKLVGIVTTFDLLQSIAWSDELAAADLALAGV
jgi:CBS domain-containing protein